MVASDPEINYTVSGWNIPADIGSDLGGIHTKASISTLAFLTEDVLLWVGWE